LVFLSTHESDSETLGSEATGTANSVEISVGVTGHIVVENDVDFLDINSTAENLCGNKNAMLEFLEPVVDLDALLLSEVTVHGLGGEGLLVKDLSQLDGVRNSLNKDDHLVEVEGIDEVGQLGVLLVLIELNVVLLETMESEFALVLNEDFSRVTHELLASLLNVTGKSSSEHHDLLVVRSFLENVLDITSHVHRVSSEESIALVKHKHLEVAQVQLLLTAKLEDTAGSTNDDVWGLEALKELDVVLDGLTTVDNVSFDVSHVLGEADELILDLVG